MKIAETQEAPVFEVDLIGHCSRVKMNGVLLDFVRDVEISQPLTGPPIITVTFLASRIKGIDE